MITNQPVEDRLVELRIFQQSFIPHLKEFKAGLRLTESNEAGAEVRARWPVVILLPPHVNIVLGQEGRGILEPDRIDVGIDDHRSSLKLIADVISATTNQPFVEVALVVLCGMIVDGVVP